jgi:hypothetical protein
MAQLLPRISIPLLTLLGCLAYTGQPQAQTSLPQPSIHKAPPAHKIKRPPLGERPSPAEARKEGVADQTRMRPPQGSAAGGIADVPVKR